MEAAPLFAAQSGALLENLIKRLFQLPAVRTIDIDRGRRSVVIDYDANVLRVEAALRSFSIALQVSVRDSPLDRLLQRSYCSVRRVERRLDKVGDQFTVRLEPIECKPTPSLRERGTYHERLRRLAYLALGAGSFVMSVVGIMTPFIPTMPFVLATGYFLAASSPTLHDLFRRSPLFGEMLCDWEEHGGWRPATKLKLVGLMVFVWAATLVILGFSWPLVITMGVMSSISIITILRVPTISHADALLREGGSRPAVFISSVAPC